MNTKKTQSSYIYEQRKGVWLPLVLTWILIAIGYCIRLAIEPLETRYVYRAVVLPQSLHFLKGQQFIDARAIAIDSILIELQRRGTLPCEHKGEKP